MHGLTALLVISHRTTAQTATRRALQQSRHEQRLDMGTGRTRKRNNADSRLSSAEVSPTLSAEGSADADDTAASRPGTLSPELDISSVDDFGLWQEAHLKDLVKQVHRHQSLDADKFDTIDGCEKLTVKELCMKLDKGINNSGLSWLPEVGLKEMVAAVASELAYVRQQRKESESTLRTYKKLRSDYDNSVAAMKSQTLETKRALNQLPKEFDARKKAEADKTKTEAKLKAITNELEEVKGEWEKALADRHNMKMMELDTRRRLDKIRLKIAATRGEMTCPTVDVLERVPPKWMVEKNVCESVTNSKEDEDKMSLPSSKEADTASDAKRKPKKKKRTDADGDVEMDSQEVPKKNSTKVGDDYDTDLKEEDPKSEDIDDIGFNEDEVAMEIRLLRNRLDMYNSECTDWIATHRAIDVQIAYVSRATVTLQHELQRIQSVSDGNDRRGLGSASKAGKARRAAHAIGDSSGASPTKRSLPQQEQAPTQSRKKRRKGEPKRNLAALEVAPVGPEPAPPAAAAEIQASGAGGDNR